MEDENRDVHLLHWGLIPFWAKDISIGMRMINARSETLQEKPSFRAAFRERRCLILADGFYEWRKPESKSAPKTPYRFSLKDNKPFAFAGLWETWSSPEREEIRSCTIITCPPNELVEQVHNRMPVILDSHTCWDWLQDRPLPELDEMLKPYPADKMQAYPVSLLVNNPRVDDPQCIQPVEPGGN
jgi:putative SOS response-associated peptidase YedK